MLSETPIEEYKRIIAEWKTEELVRAQKTHHPRYSASLLSVRSQQN